MGSTAGPRTASTESSGSGVPGASKGVAEGYPVGSVYVDTDDDTVYVQTSPTGDGSWTSVSSAGGASVVGVGPYEYVSFDAGDPIMDLGASASKAFVLIMMGQARAITYRITFGDDTTLDFSLELITAGEWSIITVGGVGVCEPSSPSNAEFGTKAITQGVKKIVGAPGTSAEDIAYVAGFALV